MQSIYSVVLRTVTEIGVYALYWEQDDLIYIGQSNCLSRRKKEHFNSLIRNKHNNYKVQEAYNKSGLPSFVILQYCDTLNLNKLESFWIKEFNSILHGLNLSEENSSPYASNRKYSKFSILKVFSLLVNTRKSFRFISARTKVHIATIKAINAGTKHTWLGEEYPDKYKILRNTVRNSFEETINNRGSKSTLLVKLIDPDGNPHIIDNLREFCKFNFSNYTSAYTILLRILYKQGRNKTYKKWKIEPI